MADLPDYLTEQTEEAIRQRMLDSLPADLDKTEGGYLWDALAPAAIELAQAAIWAQEVLRRAFASTTFGAYLDLRCEEHGLTRRPAVKAAGQVVFTGVGGTVVPAGTRVATPADPVSGTASVEFATVAAATIGPDGSAAADVEAVEAGAAGNVAAGTITLMVTPVPGVSGVSNPAATGGGLDPEDDASLLNRYLQRVRSPSAGGNKADYVNWALEVPGVGGVAVVPVRDGPGTVAVAIIDSGHVPADQPLVDAVQDYIAPPWVDEAEAEAMTLGGGGTSIDQTQPDDTGDSVRMVYDAAGPGTVRHSLAGVLQQAGVWQVRVRVKVDSTAGAADLLEVGVYNLSAAGWAKTSPGGTADAVATLRAADLGTAFADVTVAFYWNGVDQLELRVTRLTSDTTTTAWVDRAVYRSTFSQDTGTGKAPIGARVTVEPATSVLINVSAALTIIPGYNADSVRSAVVVNLRAYLQSLALQADNDVRYVRVGETILDTPGVLDYANLTLNGGTANITIGQTEVAVLGSVTLT